MIPTFYVHSENVKLLKQRFEKSMQNQNFFRLDGTQIEIDGDNGNFLTKGWEQAILSKLEINIEKLRQSVGQIVLLTDIDVQIFKPGELHDYVIDRMNKDSLDILGMQEFNYQQVNGGFICIRSSARSIQLFEKTYNFLKHYVQQNTTLGRIYSSLKSCQLLNFKYMDQSVINVLLKRERAIKYDLIREDISCWGPLRVLPSHMFHHAVCATDVEAKLALLDSTLDTFLQFNNIEKC